MSVVAARLAAFRAAAATEGVRVHVYPAAQERPAPRLLRRAVLYAVMAGSLSAAAVSVILSTAQPEPAAPSRYQSGVLANPSQAPPPAPAIEQVREDPWQTPELQDLRQRLNYVDVTFEGRRTLTLDGASRVALSKWAASQHQLHRHGLSWRDLYGTIQAETDWIERQGMGKNRVASHGIAQLEPATAKVLGITDPRDPIQAVHAAAHLLKEAGAWSRAKVAHLPAQLRANAMRDGLSVYYNLSSRARAAWNGENTAELPVETQQHIRNARQGVKDAGYIETQALRTQTRLEREADLAQARRLTEGVVVAARSDGGSFNPSVSATERSATAPAAAPAMQFSDMRGMDSLRGLLERPCARVLPPSTIVEYNSACMFANANPADPKGLPAAVPAAMLVGYFNQVPVLVVRDEDLAAEAAQLSNKLAEPDPRQPQSFDVTVVTSALVQQLADDPVAMELILAHEAGHHRLDHRDQGNHQILGAGLQQELDADYSAFQYMLGQGRSPDEMARAAERVFDQLRQSQVVAELPLLRKALDKRQTEFARHVETAREVQADLRNVLQQRVAQR